MKTYRLAGWPDLQAPFNRMAHRRMLGELSQRQTTLRQLIVSSGLRRQGVQAFVDRLVLDGFLREQDHVTHATALFGSLRPFGGWLRRSPLLRFGPRR